MNEAIDLAQRVLAEQELHTDLEVQLARALADEAMTAERRAHTIGELSRVIDQRRQRDTERAVSAPEQRPTIRQVFEGPSGEQIERWLRRQLDDDVDLTAGLKLAARVELPQDLPLLERIIKDRRELERRQAEAARDQLALEVNDTIASFELED